MSDYETDLEKVEAVLTEIAGDQFNYVYFHLHGAQSSERFFTVNLYKSDSRGIGSATSLAEAFKKAKEAL